MAGRPPRGKPGPLQPQENDRDEDLKIKWKDIYRAIVYKLKNNIAAMYYSFDDNDKCKSLLIQMDIKYYEQMKAELKRHFTKTKTGEETIGFFNKRMTAFLYKENQFAYALYQKTSSKVLKLLNQNR